MKKLCNTCFRKFNTQWHLSRHFNGKYNRCNKAAEIVNGNSVETNNTCNKCNKIAEIVNGNSVETNNKFNDEEIVNGNFVETNNKFNDEEIVNGNSVETNNKFNDEEIVNGNSVIKTETPIQLDKSNVQIKYSKIYICNRCNLSYKYRQGLYKHKLKCRINTKQDIKEDIKEDNKLDSKKNTKEDIKEDLNNHLIDIILKKNKIIKELIEKTDNINKPIINDENKFTIKNDIIINDIIINDIKIISRNEDNYIDGLYLCKMENIKIMDWFCLDNTKLFIKKLKIQTGILEFHLYEIIYNNKYEIIEFWLHPQLIINLNIWILNIFLNKTIELNNLLKYTEDELIKTKQKNQLLQDLCVKKQSRQIYPKKNVIYILTTEDNKKKRIYIIGKARELKNRLNTYNKTAEHEVVYYRECKNEDDMRAIEFMVLNKLNSFKEKANRDRFILPIEKDISFFIEFIDNAINFF